MGLSVKWDKEAEQQLDQHLHYLLTRFGTSAAESFFADVSDRMEQLLQYPESGRRSKITGIRYVQVRKSHYIYYRNDVQYVYIVGLIGTKQQTNPFR